jgi:hypothetical protein
MHLPLHGYVLVSRRCVSMSSDTGVPGAAQHVLGGEETFRVVVTSEASLDCSGALSTRSTTRRSAAYARPTLSMTTG